MMHIKFPVISRTRALENKIDCFHDKMIEAAAVFHRSIKTFLNENSRDEYKSINKQIKTIEHEAKTTSIRKTCCPTCRPTFCS